MICPRRLRLWRAMRLGSANLHVQFIEYSVSDLIRHYHCVPVFTSSSYPHHMTFSQCRYFSINRAPQSSLSPSSIPSDFLTSLTSSNSFSPVKVDKFLSQNRKKLKELPNLTELVQYLSKRNYQYTHPQFSIISQNIVDLRDRLTVQQINSFMNWFRGIELGVVDMVIDSNKLFSAFNVRIKRLQLKNPKMSITPQTLTKILEGYRFRPQSVPEDSQFLSDFAHNIRHSSTWRSGDVRAVIPFLSQIKELPETVDICASLLLKLEKIDIFTKAEIETLISALRFCDSSVVSTLDRVVSEISSKDDKILSSELNFLVFEQLITQQPNNLPILSNHLQKMMENGRFEHLTDSYLRLLLVSLEDITTLKPRNQVLEDIFLKSVVYHIHHTPVIVLKPMELPSLQNIASSTIDTTILFEELLPKIECVDNSYGDKLLSLYLQNLNVNKISMTPTKIQRLVHAISGLPDSSENVRQAHFLISNFLADHSKEIQQEVVLAFISDLLPVFTISDRSSSGRACLHEFVKLLDGLDGPFSVENMSHSLRITCAMSEDNPDFETLLKFISRHIERSTGSWSANNIRIACSKFESLTSKSSALREVLYRLAVALPRNLHDLPRGARYLSWMDFCATIKGFRRFESIHPEVRALVAAITARTSLTTKETKSSLSASVDFFSGVSSFNSHHMQVSTLLSMYLQAYARNPPLGNFSLEQLQILFSSLENKPVQGPNVEILRIFHSHLCRCLERHPSPSIESLCILLSGLSSCDETHTIPNEICALIASYLPTSIKFNQASMENISRFLATRSLVPTSADPQQVLTTQAGTETYLRKMLTLVSSTLKSDHSMRVTYPLEFYCTLLKAVQRMSLNFPEVRDVVEEIANGLKRTFQLSKYNPDNSCSPLLLAEAGLAFASISQIYNAISIHHLSGSSSMNNLSSPLSSMSAGGVINTSRLLYQLIEALHDWMAIVSTTELSSESSLSLLRSLTLMDHFTADLPQSLVEKYQSIICTIRNKLLVSSRPTQSFVDEGLVFQELHPDGTETALAWKAVDVDARPFADFFAALYSVTNECQLSLHMKNQLCQLFVSHTGVPIDILIASETGVQELYNKLHQKTSELQPDGSKRLGSFSSLSLSLAQSSPSVHALTSLQHGMGSESGLWCIQFDRVDRYQIPAEKRKNFLLDLYLQRAYGIEVKRISLQDSEEVKRSFIASLEDSWRGR